MEDEKTAKKQFVAPSAAQDALSALNEWHETKVKNTDISYNTAAYNRLYELVAALRLELSNLKGA
jgi:hypothetical protein